MKWFLLQLREELSCLNHLRSCSPAAPAPPSKHRKVLAQESLCSQELKKRATSSVAVLQRDPNCSTIHWLTSRMGFKVKSKDNVTKECLVTGLRQALKDDTKYHARALRKCGSKRLQRSRSSLSRAWARSLGKEQQLTRYVGNNLTRTFQHSLHLRSWRTGRQLGPE